MTYTKMIGFALIASIFVYSACQKSEPAQEPSKEPTKTEQPTPKEEPQADPKEGEKPKDNPEDNKQPEDDKPVDKPEDNKKPENDKPVDNPEDNKKPEDDKPVDTPEDNKKPEDDKPEEKPEEPKKPEQPNNPSPTPEKVKSTVLLVDYTGQYCHNCYTASKVLQSTQRNYNGLVVGVAMHGLESYSPQLFHPTAGAYHNHFLPKRGVPNNVFNNRPKASEGLDDMINKADIINTTASCTVNGESVSIKVSTAYRQGQEKQLEGKKLNLLFWITEDNVIATQKNSSEVYLNDYRHDDVFRGTLGNDLWGSKYSVGSAFDKSYSLPQGLKDKANGHLIILIIDDSTKEVYDVTSLPLIAK